MLEKKKEREVVIMEKTMSKNTQHEMMHFADCILNNKQPLTDIGSSLQGLRCIWRMYEAEKEGRIADLRGLGVHQHCVIK